MVPQPNQGMPQPYQEVPQPATESDESLQIVLLVDGHPAALVLDGGHRTISGLELIDGKGVEERDGLPRRGPSAVTPRDGDLHGGARQRRRNR